MRAGAAGAALGAAAGVLLCRSRFGRGGRGSILPAAFLRRSLFHGDVTGGGVILSSRDDGRRLYDDRTGSRRRKKVIIVIRPGDGAATGACSLTGAADAAGWATSSGSTG